MGNPQKASTPKGKVSVIKAARRTLPMILIPGIMGSRLTHPPSNSLVWNPLGFPIGPDAWPLSPSINFGAARLRDIDNTLEPAHEFTHLTDPLGTGDIGRAKRRHELAHHERDDIHHAYGVVWPSYREFLLAMNFRLRSKLGGLGWNLYLDCFGYDWRRSNRENGVLLDARVKEVTDACGGEKPVLVAHSMGGLVARSFIWGKRAGLNKVRKLVLVASPSLGATKPYCFLKTGIPTRPSEDRELFDPAMLAVRNLLLKLVTPNPFADRKRDVAFLRRCFAMHELSIKRLYARHENVSWLTFKPADTGLDTRAALTDGRPPQTGTSLLTAENTEVVYNDPTLGFTDFPIDRNSPLWRDRERSLDRFDAETMVFDSSGVPVRAKFHRDTTFFASSSHKTHNQVDLTLKKVKHRSGENSFITKLESTAPDGAGDFSVPIGSALPKPNVRFPKPGKATYRKKSINALHEGMCNHPTVIKLVTKLLVQQCKDDNKAGP